MTAPWTLVVFALAVARVTVLIVDDKITEKPRNAWVRWAMRKRAEDADATYLAYLVTCPWCVSIWVGAPAAYIWWNWPTAWWSLGPAVWLAFSMVTGKLAQMGD